MTWEELTGADHRVLEEVTRTGATPQDLVVLPNPGDHTLVLGKAYFLKLRVAYFVLQRETV
jgi:hypothetical protein